MKKIFLFIIPFLAVFFLFSSIANADVKLCSSSAECNANAGCISGSCVCDPQYYNCDANFGNGCEHHYACSNTCTYVEQKYCYSSNVWNTYQATDCGVGNGLQTTCSAPTSKCYASGSSASCVECLSDADCVSPKICDLSTHKCVTPPIICSCDSGATPCGSCSAVNPGKFCKDDGKGSGILVDDPNTCKGCVKYTAKYGLDAGKGANKYSAEICFDSYVAGQGYTNYVVDEYGGSGAKIKETKCAGDKCAQEVATCSGGYFLDKDGINLDIFSKMTSKTIPANTYSYYCNGGGTGGSSLPGPNPNDCDPGNPPYLNNGNPDCAKCGCPPSEYPGSTITCNAGTGLCSYVAPPCLPGEPPDCPLTTPEAEYNITYTMKTLYLLTGKSAGGFSGYNWSGSAWQADSGT